jgi:asparagine synthase (glutamine-hydrolysing)
MGFGVPIEVWFKGDLFPYAKSILLSKKMQGRQLFKPDLVSQILSDHRAGLSQNINYIWNLLTLELWFRSYFD